ncbi:MAG: YcfL family protein [Holophagaceae bacterium]|nr:YcfL family protein [Holophagaceae bacterium]
MNNRTTTFALGVASILSLMGTSACRNPETTASNKIEGSERGAQVIKDDPRFMERVEIKDKLTGRTEDGFLKAQVAVQNLGGMTEEFETKFEWFDEQGFKVDSSIEMWKPGLVYGHERKEIFAVAPNKKAFSFRFHIRKPNSLVFSGKE